jgi:hypothetical protein
MTTSSSGPRVGPQLQAADASPAEPPSRSPSDQRPRDMKQRGPAEGVTVTPDSHLEPPPLRAYLATALTGLARNEKRRVSKVSDIAAAICAELAISLYQPREATDPVHHPTVPDKEVFRLDRQHVTQSDLLIYLADYPSTGAGQELVFAYETLIPILVIANRKTQVSRMVTGIPGATFQVRYKRSRDLRKQLPDQLRSLVPILTERRGRLRQHEQNRLGEKIRQARVSKGLTHDDLAEAMGAEFFSPDQIEQWEQSGDLESNLRLMHLQEIASALKIDLRTLLD